MMNMDSITKRVLHKIKMVENLDVAMISRMLKKIPITAMKDRGHGDQEMPEAAERFRMPLQCPRFTEDDYETMPEWEVDCLLADYGMPVVGQLAKKRKLAMAAFLPSRTLHPGDGGVARLTDSSGCPC